MSAEPDNVVRCTCNHPECSIQLRKEDKYRLFFTGKRYAEGLVPLEVLMFMTPNSIVKLIEILQEMLREIGKDPRDGENR